MGLTSTLVIIALFLAVICFYFVPISERDKRWKMTELLQNLADVTLLLDQVEMKVNKMTADDPFKDLVDGQIKPAFDEMASVKKQTEIYEKMERIQGGPTNFLKTAGAILNKLEEQLMSFQQQYRELITEMHKDKEQLLADFTTINRKLLRLFTYYTEELEKVNINLDGMNSVGGPPAYKGDFTLDDIFPILSDFIQLFGKYERSHAKMKDKLLELGIEDNEDGIGTAAHPEIVAFSDVGYEIRAKLHEYDEELEALGPVLLGKLANLAKSLPSLNFEQRQKCEELMNLFSTEITRTRERMHTLKYPKASDEL